MHHNDMPEIKEQSKTVYELAFLLKTGETDAALSEFLTKAGASIVYKGQVAPITLSYTIKKQPSASFGYYHLTFAEGINPVKLSHELDLKDYLLRHLFVKTPKKSGRAALKERIQAARISKDAPVAAPAKAGQASGATRLDGLSNEKLEQTLEEILK